MLSSLMKNKNIVCTCWRARSFRRIWTPRGTGQTYGHRFRIVTLDGQILQAGGAMTGGSTSAPAHWRGRSLHAAEERVCALERAKTLAGPVAAGQKLETPAAQAKVSKPTAGTRSRRAGLAFGKTAQIPAESLRNGMTA
ncbi:MAG: hypothetical protein ACLT4C_07580 [Butyricicoccus sp.]